MPVFERLFDFATETRLNELMNTNNPLLKRLMLEAPGTYHHSLIVAVMAEAAAELIGANALLCKTAAYYHDVGKLASPKYFKENQGEYNIHDDLSPEESARRIIAHPLDSAALLEKNKFPSEIVRMARNHHGDSVVAYFYNKARTNAANPDAVDINTYRYKSSKPHTKEDAILMLADCCEAAVRAIKHPTNELIEERVNAIVNSLWRTKDGQLTESPLTAQDVSRIEEIFIKNLLAQYHERIEYPSGDQQKISSLQRPQQNYSSLAQINANDRRNNLR
jgi:putative nucleotidyltransferase with HDIG domain